VVIIDLTVLTVELMFWTILENKLSKLTKELLDYSNLNLLKEDVFLRKMWKAYYLITNLRFIGRVING